MLHEVRYGETLTDIAAHYDGAGPLIDHDLCPVSDRNRQAFDLSQQFRHRLVRKSCVDRDGATVNKCCDVRVECKLQPFRDPVRSPEIRTRQHEGELFRAP